MIQLPDNWQDYLQVSPKNNALWLHLYNGAGQFMTTYFRLDPAFPLQKTLEELESKIHELMIVEQAYIIENDMSLVKTEPADQNWGPAPIPGLDIMSLKQYQAMQQTPSAETPKAAPIPGPEGLPPVG